MTLAVFNGFFSSAPGYLLETLPFALFSGLVYLCLKIKKDRKIPLSQLIRSVLFTTYVAEVVCMVFFFSSIRYFWGFLFLNYKPDNIIDVLFLRGTANFIPDFYKNMNREKIMNLFLYLPFGVLYPLAHPGRTWKKTILAGSVFIIITEILQPLVGRAFDINDIILNTFGLLTSATAFRLFSQIIKNNNSSGDDQHDTI